MEKTVMSKEKEELDTGENFILNNKVNVEFRDVGLMEKLDARNLKYRVVFRTPLHKCASERKTVSIKPFWLDAYNLVVIALQNPKSVRTHNFFVFDTKKHRCDPFMSGVKNGWQFINVMINVYDEKDRKKVVKVVSLPTVKEYLDDIQKTLDAFVDVKIKEEIL